MHILTKLSSLHPAKPGRSQEITRHRMVASGRILLNVNEKRNLSN